MIDQKKAKDYLKKYRSRIRKGDATVPTYAQYLRSLQTGGTRNTQRQVETLSTGDWDELKKRFMRK